MRLSKTERTAIRAAVRRADGKARIYLFGSRADDRLRGGDIDLLVLSDRLALRDKLDILVELKERLGDRKIDLMIADSAALRSDPFVARAWKSAVPLTAARARRACQSPPIDKAG